jgi:large subunit ribosomal protein L9
MEVLLLQDIPGIGKKNDLLVVGDGYALNYLLPRRAALVATPLVRKRYAEFIKRRAEEREREKSAVVGVVQALSGKVISFARKATKTGKLYAAITEKDIVEALKKQLETTVSEDSVKIDEQIKALGMHQIMLQISEQTFSLSVNVTEEKAK